MSRDATRGTAIAAQGRRWALSALCLGVLMIAIDASIVNVALPSIGTDLHFSKASLVWVVNAYLSTYGGFWLVGGRLGDLFGHRRLFSIGIALFTLASLGCALATSPGMLVAARAIQGLAGAIVSTMSITLIMNLFTEASMRVKALGILTFVAFGTASLSLLLGGVLTSVLGWHWIFLINIPIGVVVCVLSVTLMPRDREKTGGARLDVAGAATVTISLVMASYAILDSSQTGWNSLQTLILLGGAGLLLLGFIGIEAGVQTPIMPLRLFRLRSLTVALIAGTLLTAALSAWTFFSALYMQYVLQFTPLQVGLAFLPATVVGALVSIIVVPALLTRFGIQRLLVVGMLTVSIGLALFARMPVNGDLLLDVIPGMLLLGLGVALVENPLTLGALSDVATDDSGIASGIVNTSLTMGGTLGLSVLSSIAASRTDELLLSGVSTPFALSSGYQVVYWIGAIFAAAGAVVSGVFFRIAPVAVEATA